MADNIQNKRAEIVSVGTELLLGDILNTNAQFLAQELAALGYSVYYQTVIGDNATRLDAFVREAKQRSDVLIFTGGLGPTEDDLTKETVAACFGDELVLDEEELAKMEAFFRTLGRRMTPNNRKQAFVPKHGEKLPNANGTAPGALFREGEKMAFLLPGPPREMRPMFADSVRPRLAAAQNATLYSQVLRFFGIGESELEAKAEDLLAGGNPTAALYAKTGEVHLRITSRAADLQAAKAMCEAHAELFRSRFGELIYSEDGSDMETVVVQALAGKGKTLATAESCTGGLLSGRITSVPGASAVFGFGLCSYANSIKHRVLGVRQETLDAHGAVSAETAREMAFGALQQGQADFAAATTGIAGPDGGTPEKPVGLVYVAVCDHNTAWVKRLHIADRGRDYVRTLATHHALDMVRRLVAGLPIPEAETFAR